jgi:hypothetical protein
MASLARDVDDAATLVEQQRGEAVAQRVGRGLRHARGVEREGALDQNRVLADVTPLQRQRFAGAQAGEGEHRGHGLRCVCSVPGAGSGQGKGDDGVRDRQEPIADGYPWWWMLVVFAGGGPLFGFLGVSLSDALDSVVLGWGLAAAVTGVILSCVWSVVRRLWARSFDRQHAIDA